MEEVSGFLLLRSFGGMALFWGLPSSQHTHTNAAHMMPHACAPRRRQLHELLKRSSQVAHGFLGPENEHTQKNMGSGPQRAFESISYTSLILQMGKLRPAVLEGMLRLGQGWD